MGLITTRPLGRVFVCALLVFVFACGENEEKLALPDSKRVVSLAPNITEMLFFAGAQKRLIGTDDFSDYPPAAKNLTKVGGTQPNIEKIIALRPDLVLASTSSKPPGLESSLRAAEIPLVWVKTDRLSEVPGAVGIVGGLVGVLDVPVYVRKLQDRIAEQRRTRAHPPRVLFVVWTDPIYVAGHDTFVGDLVELCGAANAAPVKGWPQYSLESLVANPPDIILYPQPSVTPEAMQQLLVRAPGVAAHARLIGVDEGTFERPGPRVVEAARQLNAILDLQK